jgi:serine/threonine protein phosphatase PrpC
MLTDVGRRRERNQDNVTSHIPSEPEVLAEKGALFVVCDGMGGHAAGEVAADLGVQTIRDVYFDIHGQDVITTIAQAVKSANEMIYSTARATVEYGGMGTTCVALVVAGGRGYIVNIGDSRAYIARDGSVRQVTQDHSWVAEQVRNGVITEEQARVHAHRNVITRSLGTMPSITADLFVETLHDGDRVLLCSDGLHGYVEQEAIFQELLTQRDPDRAVRNLIDMANANGGPDNITAVIVDILEAPAVDGPLPLPPDAKTPIEEGETQPLPVPRGAAVAAKGAAVKAQNAALARASSQTKVRSSQRKKRSGPGMVALRILEVAAALLVIASVWYVGFGPLAAQRQADANTQSALSHARRVTQAAANQSPTDALAALAQAQQQINTSLNNPVLSSSARQQAQTFLAAQFTTSVQAALRNYDSTAHIQRITLQDAVTYSLSCTQISTQTPAPTVMPSFTSLVAVSGANGKPIAVSGQLLYGLSNGQLYEIVVGLDATGAPESDAISCAQVSAGNLTSVIALAPNGAALDALGTTVSGGHEVAQFTPQPAAAGALPALKAKILLTTAIDGTPNALFANGSTLYISFTQGTTNPSGIWRYKIPSKGKVPPPTEIPAPKPVTALQMSGGSLFLALADGSLGQLDPKTNAFEPVSVLAPEPLIQDDPATYTSAAPVPTPANGAAFGAGSALVNDPFNPADLLLTDTNPSAHRFIQLSANTSGPGAGLVGQYLYNGEPTLITLLTVGAYAPAAKSPAVGQIYAWNGSELIAIPASHIAA